MSSGIATPPPETPVAPPTECEVIIERRLRETRRHVKGVDLADGILTFSIGVLVFLLLAAAVDHWLIAGGLGFWGRLVMWLALVGMAATCFVLRILPPLVRRINPVFAAATIEKSQQSLKNSLINFLLVRGRREEIAPPVYRAMEYRAAADLSQVELDTAVDRTHVIRLGYVLVAVLAVFSLYLVVSPKNPIRSAVRVLWPWSAVEAPTRVTIRGVQPGDAVAFHDDSITVSAEASGLREGEPILLIYRTADGQSVDQPVPMKRPEGEYRYQCRLPPGEPGLQQNLEYYLTAGDYRTPSYRVDVRMAPAMDVDKVSYRYPAYTGIAEQTVERQGDLRAIEGTNVTIRATANTDIKPGTAVIDLGCDGRHEVNMTAEGRTAVGRLTLHTAKDAAGPQYDFYQLRFADLSGRKNSPVRYRIDVTRDMPPKVELVEPQKEEVEVPENGKLAIGVRAEDPDFALRRVTLCAQCGEKRLPIAPLLEKKSSEKPWPGVFSATYSFEPSHLGLKAGDRVRYWAEAQDNKEPTAGQSATGEQWITVVRADASRQSLPKPDGAQQGDRQPSDQGKSGQEKSGQEKSNQGPGDQADQNQPPKDQPKDSSAAKQPSPTGQPPKDGKPDQQQKDAAGQNESTAQADSSKSSQNQSKSESGQSGQDKGKQSDKQQGDQNTSEKQPGNEPSTKPNERIDPETNPGDAIQEMLKDRQKEQQGQSGKDQSKSDDQQAGKQPNSSQNNGDNSSGNQPSGNQPSGNQPSGNQPSGNQPSGNQPSGNQPSGNQPSGNQPSGNQPSGNQPSGNQPSGNQPSGNQPSGNQPSGNQPSGNQSNEQQPADGKAGDQNSGNAQSAAGKGDEKSTAEKTQGEKGKGNQAGSENSAGAKPGDAQGGQPQPSGKKPDAQAPTREKPGASPSGNEKSGTENVGKQQPRSASEPQPGEGKSPEQQTGDKRAGEQPPTEKQSPSEGKQTGDSSASPLPQSENLPRDKKPGELEQTQGQPKGDQTQSPSTSNKQSDSKDETAGERSGQADQGGSKANQRSDDEVGPKAGDRAASQKPTGGEAKTKAKEGEGTGQQSSDQKAEGKPSHQDNSAQGGTPQQKPPDGAMPAQETANGSGGHGSGNLPGGGGRSGEQPGVAKPPEAVESEADEANIEYARQQTELALEHLRNQVAKERPRLLDQLGWTKEDARRFLDRWEQMKQAAAQKGAEGAEAKKQLNDALQSLGLSPRGTELRHDGMTREQPTNLRDAGRFLPPPDWLEQFREYNRGINSAEQQKPGK